VRVENIRNVPNLLCSSEYAALIESRDQLKDVERG
jgi:hypothetical protein